MLYLPRQAQQTEFLLEDAPYKEGIADEVALPEAAGFDERGGASARP